MTALSIHVKQAEAIAKELFALHAKATPLPGEMDANFLLESAQGKFILKISPPEREKGLLDFQNQALKHLHTFAGVPRLLPTPRGETMPTVLLNGLEHHVRLFSYLPGIPLASLQTRPLNLIRSIGQFVAHLDQALAGFQHPAMHRKFLWNLSNANEIIRPRLEYISTQYRKNQIEQVLARFEGFAKLYLPALRAQTIHNDANDYNILVDEGRVVGLIDFGDMVYAPLVCEVAVAAAYALLGETQPLQAAIAVVAGYHAVHPLTITEISLLYDLICTRLALSLAISSERAHTEPNNPYHQISATPAWDALEHLLDFPPEYAHAYFRQACGLATELLVHLPSISQHPSADKLLNLRRRHLNPALSLSYRQPLHVVRGQGQYLYDAQGNAYLDCVNNVCHVGHSHPGVVAALAAQAALLNTNTRYLHENIIHLAQRLTAHMPGDLSVWFFVNSGSEANDLALRLARAYTGQQDMLVLEGAYHGNLTSLIDISPYKFDGPGGKGAPPWVHKLTLPCAYRGAFRNAPHPIEAYAAQAEEILQRLKRQGKGVAAFIAEPLMGTAGQVVFPKGYLQSMFALVRSFEGVCIADEVQVGFGRVGTHFWGFESQGVVPDIVTMGKPMGNGHPLAAVVTTPQIAAAFVTGMEYFNTFGGNPVSCAIGLAVLDIIEGDGLQAHALRVGTQLLEGLHALKQRFALIGDVRGSGLFLGIELVRDRESLEPAEAEAYALVEAMRQRHILLSVDGIWHNVIKFKPPMVFNQEDAQRLLEELELVMQTIV